MTTGLTTLIWVDREQFLRRKWCKPSWLQTTEEKHIKGCFKTHLVIEGVFISDNKIKSALIT